METIIRSFVSFMCINGPETFSTLSPLQNKSLSYEAGHTLSAADLVVLLTYIHAANLDFKVFRP